MERRWIGLTDAEMRTLHSVLGEVQDQARGLNDQEFELWASLANELATGGSMESHLIKYFAYDDLPPRLANVSKPFYELAEGLLTLELADQRELAVALRKLLESRDAAVRSML